MNKKLSTIESILLLLMITINTILLNAPKMILTNTGSRSTYEFNFYWNISIYLYYNNK